METSADTRLNLSGDGAGEGSTKYYLPFAKFINRYKKVRHCGINLVVPSSGYSLS